MTFASLVLTGLIAGGDAGPVMTYGSSGCAGCGHAPAPVVVDDCGCNGGSKHGGFGSRMGGLFSGFGSRMGGLFSRGHSAPVDCGCSGCGSAPVGHIAPYAGPAPHPISHGPVHAAPVHAHAAPVHAHGAPALSAAAPVYGAPTPVHSSPAAVQSAPTYSAPALNTPYSAPAVQTPRETIKASPTKSSAATPVQPPAPVAGPTVPVLSPVSPF